MPLLSVDPARLNGVALTNWYRRSPDEIERARQAEEEQRYSAFFGQQQTDSSFGQPSLRHAVYRPNDGADFGAQGNLSPLRYDAAYATDQSQSSAKKPYTSGSQATSSFQPTSHTHTSVAAPRNSATRAPAASTPPRPDPSRTEVFQPGPDGKLHPIPGWHTTGPLDFKVWSHNIDWGGVASDLTDIAAGALDFMGLGGLAGDVVKGLGYEIGPDVVRGIVHGHHSWPKFLGGPQAQELAKLHQSLHRMFHRDLEVALKQAGFPRVGGRNGGTVDWKDYFANNAGSREEAIEILKRVTREYDKKNGTQVSRYLEKTLK